MSQFKTINELFQVALQKYNDKPLYFTKDAKKNFQGVSLKEIYNKAQSLGCYLIELGVESGDRVGLMSDNRVEWAIADITALIIGSSNVPRGSDSTPQEIEYILEHSGSKVCFIEHEKLLTSVLPEIPKTQVQKIIVLDSKFKLKEDNPMVISLEDAIKEGEALREKHLEELKKREKEVKEDDLFTIIYTSGTTGLPKGVMLTHRNMIYNVVTVPPMVGIAKEDRSLTILPVWHIFERAMYYAIISQGVGYYYTNVRDLRDDFARVKPTFMASAPRLWENLYMGIKAKVDKASPIQKMLFDAAYDICKNYRNAVDYLEGNKLMLKEEDPIEKAQNTALSLFTSVNLMIPA
ncbi:MAG: AMP-binding protein, partial [Leptospiraceae bacterium]|nr:AMP-binding protein [Leptospiraceae bacterium]